MSLAGSINKYDEHHRRVKSQPSCKEPTTARNMGTEPTNLKRTDLATISVRKQQCLGKIVPPMLSPSATSTA